jgi:hypothetical protein
VTDTPPVDTAPSTPAPTTPDGSTADTAEAREQFAQFTAAALGEWMAAQPWQRQAIGAIAPRLARSLWMADMVIDSMIGDAPYEDAQAEAIMAELIGLPEPEPLLARLGRCTATIALPDEDAFAYCGTRLVGGRCPFAAHHAT